MTTEHETLDFDVDDPSYRACYVFEPGSISNDVNDDRPRKKRKTVSHEQDGSSPEWPRLCDGEEPQVLATARQDTFTKFWARQESRLQSIADEVEEMSLNSIAQYVDKPDTGQRKLRTAVVVCGTNGKNLSHLLSQQRNTSPQTVYCELQSTQATNLQTALKALIRNAIVSHGGSQAYAAHLAACKRRIPMPFDLQLLQEYISTAHLNKVLLSIPDAETFELNILSQLLANLTSWKDRIPFVAVLGLATTVSLFESRMSKSTLRLLDAEVFSLTFNKDKYFELFSAAQLGALENNHDEASLSILLGPAATDSLYEISKDQSATPHAFTQALKYCYMTHFFANSLSALLGDIDSESNISVLCQAIRNTASFQKHCAALLDGQVSPTQMDTVQRLLNSDRELLQYSQRRLQETYATLQQMETKLHLLAVVCHRLEPSTKPFPQYHRLLKYSQKDAIEDSEAYGLIVSVLPSLDTASLAHLLDDMMTFIPRIDNPSLKAFMTRPPTTPAPFVSALSNLLQTLKPPSTTPYLSEAVLVTRARLVTNFVPRPRFAISRALVSPVDYLGCNCCTTSNKGTEPTSILYQLLDEAGREVNVMDLWTTFRDNILASRSLPAHTSSNSTSKPKTNNGTATGTPKAKTSNKTQQPPASQIITPGNEARIETSEENLERKALMLFYTALAELKYLGLVKSASDRRLNKGVEVLSKVSWHGL